MSDVALSNSMRSTLLSLKGVGELFDRTQVRLNTNRKVNVAADNPLTFFQSSALNSRASSLKSLLDGVALGIGTIEQADSGLKSIGEVIASLRGIANSALNSASSAARISSAPDVNYSANALGAFPNVASVTSITITPTVSGKFTPAAGFPAPAAFTIAVPVAAALRVPGDTTGRAAQSIANSINKAAGNTGPTVDGVLRPYIVAAVDSSGRFTIDNKAGATSSPPSAGTLRVQVAGGTLANLFGAISAPTAAATATDTGIITSSENTNRAGVAGEYRKLIDQITAFAKDSTFNGTNLLMGQSFEMIFTEDFQSRLKVTGGNFDASSLGIRPENADFDFQSDSEINEALGALNRALNAIRTQASEFAGIVGIAKTRQEFTKASIKTLTIGAETLVGASQEEESANLLALQTRQQLSTQALSLAAQSEQAVLRLFG
jgi:flagellin